MGTVVTNVPPSSPNGRNASLLVPPPLLGEHTKEIATELLAMSEAEYQRLTDDRVFY